MSSDERMIAVLVALGLAVLWAVLFRIVASASRRLHRHHEFTEWLRSRVEDPQPRAKAGPAMDA